METVSPYTVSATNRSGLIVIVETLFMTWMIIVNLIRLYMRLAINGPVKIDDVVVFTGSVSSICYYSPPQPFLILSLTPQLLNSIHLSLMSIGLHFLDNSHRSCRNNHGRNLPWPGPIRGRKLGFELSTRWKGRLPSPVNL